jgi:hypothetical protein
MDGRVQSDWVRCALVAVALSRWRGGAARPVPGRERSGRPVYWAGRVHANATGPRAVVGGAP